MLPTWRWTAVVSNSTTTRLRQHDESTACSMATRKSIEHVLKIGHRPTARYPDMETYRANRGARYPDKSSYRGSGSGLSSAPGRCVARPPQMIMQCMLTGGRRLTRNDRNRRAGQSVSGQLEYDLQGPNGGKNTLTPCTNE